MRPIGCHFSIPKIPPSFALQRQGHTAEVLAGLEAAVLGLTQNQDALTYPARQKNMKELLSIFKDLASYMLDFSMMRLNLIVESKDSLNQKALETIRKEVDKDKIATFEEVLTLFPNSKAFKELVNRYDALYQKVDKLLNK